MSRILQLSAPECTWIRRNSVIFRCRVVAPRCLLALSESVHHVLCMEINIETFIIHFSILCLLRVILRTIFFPSCFCSLLGLFIINDLDDSLLTTLVPNQPVGGLNPMSSLPIITNDFQDLETNRR